MNHYYKDVGGWFKFKPAFDLILSKLPANTPSTFVEIGLWLGRSTAYLGVEIVNSGKPVSVVAIDHFKGQPEITGWRAELVPGSEAAFRKNIEPVAKAMNGRLKIVVSDSVKAADDVPDDSVDVVWLDAAHDYDGIKRDMEAWRSKVKVGGFFGGDDFIKCEGVGRAVRERYGARFPENHYWLVQRTKDGVEFLS